MINKFKSKIKDKIAILCFNYLIKYCNKNQSLNEFLIEIFKKWANQKAVLNSFNINRSYNQYRYFFHEDEIRLVFQYK